MVNQHRHPLRGIRGVEPEDWEAFGVHVEEAGKDRSGVLRDFIRWYINAPDAEMPTRPETTAG